MAKVYKFTAVVENTIACTSSTNVSLDAACSNNSKGATAMCTARENVEWAIEMLAASRQQEIYIRLISEK